MDIPSRIAPGPTMVSALLKLKRGGLGKSAISQAGSSPASTVAPTLGEAIAFASPAILTLAPIVDTFSGLSLSCGSSTVRLPKICHPK
ncbi:MAG TPA: hypothetical protein DEV81_26355 [Cyanobacteria bacterium UBA11049]|nr:hypothetical protein [Cyanobacteria bacterium UBA11049]